MQPNYDPQGYAPQAAPPQYAPQPQYAPAPQPAYPPQGYAPAAQPAPQPQPAAPQAGWGGPAPQGVDQFGAPAPAVGIIRPRLTDMGAGRLLLITPTKIERDVPNTLSEKPGATQDRMTCDVVILDGPPFPYGGNPEARGGRPHDRMAQIPYESLSMWISNALIVAQCERAVGGGMVLGRLGFGESKTPGRQNPWKLTDPTEADKEIARAYLLAKQQGRIAAPAPQAPPQAAPQPQYAPPQSAPPAQPQYPPQGYAPAAQPAPQPQYAPAPAAGAPLPPPPGWAPEAWAAVPPEQQAMIAQSMAAGPGI